MDESTGPPDVTVSVSGPDTAKVFDFQFSGLKGQTGAAAGFGEITATVGATVGVPSVSVEASGPDTAKNLAFTFTNLKGEPGQSVGSIQRTAGTGAPGTTDTYTMYDSGGGTIGTFTVYNGTDGTGSGDFKADGSVPMTGDLNAGEHKIINVAAPTADGDAADKAYVDSAVDNVEIVKTVSGSVISVSDSADYRLLGLKLYGKSVQDGVPTPEAPVEIESVGDGGDIGVKIQGKNLIYTTSVTSTNGVTISKNDDGTFTLNGTVTGSNAGIYFFGKYDQPKQLLPNGSYKYKVDGLFDNDAYAIRSIDNGNQAQVINGDVLTYSYPIYQVLVILRLGNTYDNVIIKPMLVYGDDMPDEFVPGIEPQILTYPTPNGLPGIPVDSGGNYTDEEGQQWICDEVDFGRGKYVQRVKKISNVTFNASDISSPVTESTLYQSSPLNLGVSEYSKALCDGMQYSRSILQNNITGFYVYDATIRARF